MCFRHLATSVAASYKGFQFLHISCICSYLSQNCIQYARCDLPVLRRVEYCQLFEDTNWAYGPEQSPLWLPPLKPPSVGSACPFNVKVGPSVLTWVILYIRCIGVMPWTPDLWIDFQAHHQTSRDWISLAVTGMCLILVTNIRPKPTAGSLPSFILDLLHQPGLAWWLNLAAIPGPALHASLWYCGTELWLSKFLAWWMCHCVWLPASPPLENSWFSKLLLLTLLHTVFFHLGRSFSAKLLFSQTLSSLLWCIRLFLMSFCIGFAWQRFGSRRTTRVASVRSC